MLEIISQFVVILVIISVPCYAFYKVGIRTGIERQILRELTLCGVIEKAEPGHRH